MCYDRTIHKYRAVEVRCQVHGTWCSFCQFGRVKWLNWSKPHFLIIMLCLHTAGSTSITFAVCPRSNSVPTCTLVDSGFPPDAMMNPNIPIPAFSLASGVSHGCPRGLAALTSVAGTSSLRHPPSGVDIHYYEYIRGCAKFLMKRFSHVSL